MTWGEPAVYCTGVVTRKIGRIGRRPGSRAGRPQYLYIAEHMEAKGINDERLAGRLDVARETVTRWRNEQSRLNPYKIDAIAKALGLKSGMELWRPPGRPSLDAALTDAPDELVKQFAEMAAIYSKRVANG